MHTRARRLARSAAVTVALGALMLAGQSLPALAGEVREPYFVYAEVDLTGDQASSRIMAQRAGHPARTAFPITGDLALNYNPAMSLDGRVLAFLRQNVGTEQVRLIATVDGRPVLRVADGLGPMTVTPDGSTITWVTTGGSVRAYRVATGEQVTLCDTCGAGGAYVALSPDGRKLALRIADSSAPAKGNSRLVIYRLSDQRVLARSPRIRTVLDLTVSWRPDSRQIAFVEEKTTDKGSALAIGTMTVQGTVAPTAFDATRQPLVGESYPIYTSPAWVGGVVRAIRMEQIGPERARLTPVSAATWEDVPVAGRTLRVRSTFTAIFAAVGSWTTARPAG